ncbi:MAG: phosphopentomutase [Bacilli bacterium]
MKKYKRTIIIVMDSLGIGNAIDAKKFNDEGANTFGHIVEKVPNIKIPTLRMLGIKDLVPNLSGDKAEHLNSYTFKLNEHSNGKDTMTGHWEMMGILTTKPFISFTDTGFPEALIKELEEKTGYELIGNYASSGTEILEKLGEECMNERKLIVYTSADSVLQLCAHEDTIPVKELYRCCEIAREVCMKPEYRVGRIIARPFIGKDKNSFKRTPNRHDIALDPTGITAMDILKNNGYTVSCIGKIADIFNNVGVSQTQKTISNVDGMNKTIKEIASTDYEGLCFVNLVEFDSEYGHRRNYNGYAQAIETFDTQLKELMDIMRDTDLLMITADHGNDPTWVGSDHTREQVPLIVYSKQIKDGRYVGERQQFADMGATVLEDLGLKSDKTMIGTPIKEIL